MIGSNRSGVWVFLRLVRVASSRMNSLLLKQDLGSDYNPLRVSILQRLADQTKRVQAIEGRLLIDAGRSDADRKQEEISTTLPSE